MNRLNKTQKEITRLWMEDNRLSAIKLAEKVGTFVRHGSPKNGYREVRFRES